MTRSKTTILIGKGFIILCMFSLSYVALLSFFSPQATMDLVNTHLPNNDAISSIRGVYGGVGLSIVLLLAYLWKYDASKALLFLGFFWAFMPFREESLLWWMDHLVALECNGALLSRFLLLFLFCFTTSFLKHKHRPNHSKTSSGLVKKTIINEY